MSFIHHYGWLFPVVLTLAAAPSGGAGWTTFRNNDRNTGVTEVQLESISEQYTGRKPWSFETHGLIWSTPVVDEDNVTYVGSTDRHFYALDPQGKEIWKLMLRDEPDAIVDSAAAVDATTVYIPGGDDLLYAVDKRTGEVNWTFRAHHADEDGREMVNSLEGNVAFGPNGWLYVPSDNGYVYAIDRSGKEVWSYRTHGQQFLWSLPAFAPDASWAAFGSLDKILYIVDPQTGKELTFLDLGAEIKASPAIDADGNIFIGQSAGKFHSFEVVEEDGRWSLQERFSYTTGGQIYGSAAIHDDNVVFASHDGFVYNLTKDGELQWKYQTGAAISASPIITTDGVVISGSGNGTLYALDLASGKRIWSYFAADRYFKVNIDASPAVSPDGRILIGSFDGRIHSIPYEYCLQSDDPRCKRDEGGDHPVYAGDAVESDGASLRYIDPRGRSTGAIQRDVEPHEILSFRMVEVKDGKVVPNAAVAAFGLKIRFDPPIDFTWQVSTDNYYLNIAPKSFWPAGADYTLKITGDYFHRTGPILDYFKFFFLPDFEYESELVISAAEATDRSGGLDLDGQVWAMRSIYVAQPSVLDSLIAAAVDGQRFLMTVIDFDEDKNTGLVLINHAMDTRDGVQVIADPEKSVLWKMQRAHDVLRFHGKFPFMAMGSGAMIESFTSSARLEGDSRLEHGVFSGQTSCLAMKSNQEAYFPSLNVIDDMCDYKFDFNMVGSFVADALRRPTKPGIELKQLVRAGSDIRVDLDVSEPGIGQDGHVLAVIQLEADGSLASFHTILIRDKGEISTTVPIANCGDPCRIIVVVDEVRLFAGVPAPDH